MLNQAETIELIKRCQNDDTIAKEKILIENSPLIKSVIKRYINKGIEFDDLYQLGCLGFLKAINNFDDSFNVKFSTYAVPMIAGEVKRFLRDNGIIKVSRSTKQLNMQINKYIEEYVAEHEKSPTVDEIATRFDISKQEVVYAMESSRLPVSLSTTIQDEDSSKEISMLEKVEDQSNSLDKKMDNVLLYQIINNLTPRDGKIILLRYFRDKTQKEIAVELGVSQVQISRLESKILLELKKRMV